MKIVHESGTRKKSKARATLREGKGKIRYNHILLDNVNPRLVRMKISEPIILAGDLAKNIDIDINSFGGGSMAQANAARLAVARGLVEYTKSNALKNQFLKYDRHMLVADVRNKEMCKPNDSKARAKRQKSYR